MKTGKKPGAFSLKKIYYHYYFFLSTLLFVCVCVCVHPVSSLFLFIPLSSLLPIHLHCIAQSLILHKTLISKRSWALPRLLPTDSIGRYWSFQGCLNKSNDNLTRNLLCFIHSQKGTWTLRGGGRWGLRDDKVEMNPNFTIDKRSI